MGCGKQRRLGKVMRGEYNGSVIVTPMPKLIIFITQRAESSVLIECSM